MTDDRGFFAARIVALLVTLPPLALAAESSLPRVGLYVEGAHAGQLRPQLLRLLPASVVAVDEKEITDVLGQAGLHPNRGELLRQPGDHGRLGHQVRGAASARGLAMVILGRSSEARGSCTLWLFVIDTQSGAIELDKEFSVAVARARHRTESVTAPRDQLSAALAPAFDRLSTSSNQVVAAAPSDSSSPAGSAPLASGPKTARDASGRGAESDQSEVEHSFADVDLTYAVAGRSMSLGGGTATTVGPYHGFWISQFGLDAEAFWDRFAPKEWLRNIGLGLDYRRSIGLTSAAQNASKQTYGTVWQEFDLAVRYRLAVSKLWLVPGVGFGQSSLSFDFPATSALHQQSPDASYKFLRFEARGRVPVAMLFVQFGMAYRWIVSAGDLGNTFAHDSVWGFDADAGLTYPLLSRLEVGGALFYTRFSHSYSPASAGAATSAADQYYGIRAAAITHF
jgi:hypothetical protein